MTSKGQTLYTQSDSSCGRGQGNRGRYGQARSGRGPNSTTGTFGRRGTLNNDENLQNRTIMCGYCGKYCHLEEDCWKKSCEMASTSHEYTNYANKSGCEDHKGPVFIMKHETNSMFACMSKLEDVYFVDSSNHMMSHGE